MDPAPLVKCPAYGSAEKEIRMVKVRRQFDCVEEAVETGQ